MTNEEKIKYLHENQATSWLLGFSQKSGIVAYFDFACHCPVPGLHLNQLGLLEALQKIPQNEPVHALVKSALYAVENEGSGIWGGHLDNDGRVRTSNAFEKGRGKDYSSIFSQARQRVEDVALREIFDSASLSLTGLRQALREPHIRTAVAKLLEASQS